MEIDESIFGTRKYNRGRSVKGTWVLGGVERNSSNSFFVRCDGNRRDHHTLIRLIREHVRPGSIIITDGWRGYNRLADHGYTHMTVNHSQNFVNPITGAHTNTMEGSWFHAKRHLRRGTGWLRRDPHALALALGEFIWRKNLGLKQDGPSCARYFSEEFPLLQNRVFS